MILNKLFGQSAKRLDAHKRLEEEKPQNNLERFERALFEISSIIRGPKDLPTILAFIARESLKFAKAYRFTIFLMEGKSGNLKIQYTYAPDPVGKQVSQFEEKGSAWAVNQRKPVLLQGPNDFSNFFDFEEREQKITSLLCIPLSFQGKGVGALSLVLNNGKRSFNEQDLKYLSVIGNQASFAIENARLRQELDKEISLRRVFEKYLDDILQRLQSNDGKEGGRIEGHRESVTLGQIDGENDSSSRPAGERIAGVDGNNPLPGERHSNSIQEDRSDLPTDVLE
jgi:GAF domain-containing protein